MALSINELWNFGSNQSIEAGLRDSLKHKFLATQSGECFSSVITVVVKNRTLLDVADSVSEALRDSINPPITTGSRESTLLVTGKWGGTYETLVILQRIDSGNTITQTSGPDTPKDTVTSITVEVVSHRKAIEGILNHIEKSFVGNEPTSIKWLYKYGGGYNHKEVYLGDLSTKLLPEYYASTINREGRVLTNPILFLDKYLKSKATVLILSGPPGTGKTTMLRHLISDFNLDTQITYDEDLLKNDSVIQGFLFGNSDLMIIEDADHIIGSRELELNALMTRFLNMSDGLIKMPNKKIVFTTNIMDFNKIDSALLRPGRCYDILHTRKLSYVEACNAARVAELPAPIRNKDYTLAEIFNPAEENL
jgi:ATPase family associated with various cellular activities (AAA)